MSWCTVWKGAPQDLMDHVRGAHKVPEEVQLYTLFPPWTVTRQVYRDSLTSHHSGISNDILLFSDIGLSLVHHYRVHKRGLPMSRFAGTICHSSSLYCPSLRFRQPRGDCLIRNVRWWGILRMSCAPHLDRLDARLLTGGQLGSWRHRDGLHLVSQYRIHWPRRGQWCLTAPSSVAGGNGRKWYGAGGD